MVQGVTATVFTGAWGEHFKDCIPGWWDAVLVLDPAPDEVLLVAGDPDRIGLAASIPTDTPFPVRVVRHDGPYTVAEFWNTAIREASGEWLVPCPIDDRLTPTALIDIPAASAAGADIIADGLRFKNTGAVWHGQWIPELIGKGMTLPTMAPFRREFAQQMAQPFPPVYYSDWGFYINCAVAGAIGYQSSNIRMIYSDDLGVGRESEMSAELEKERNLELADYLFKVTLPPTG